MLLCFGVQNKYYSVTKKKTDYNWTSNLIKKNFLIGPRNPFFLNKAKNLA